MPQGFQVFNAFGALILDIGSRPYKQSQDVIHTLGGGDTNVSEPALASATPLYQQANDQSTADAGEGVVTIVGTNVTVSDGDAASNVIMKLGFF